MIEDKELAKKILKYKIVTMLFLILLIIVIAKLIHHIYFMWN